MQAAAGEGVGLEFDKDNSTAMAFVAAASNLRSRVFQVICKVAKKFMGTTVVAARDELRYELLYQGCKYVSWCITVGPPASLKTLQYRSPTIVKKTSNKSQEK